MGHRGILGRMGTWGTSHHPRRVAQHVPQSYARAALCRCIFPTRPALGNDSVDESRLSTSARAFGPSA